MSALLARPFFLPHLAPIFHEACAARREKWAGRLSMACFLIAYSLCGTRRAHTNCRLQIPTLRFGICKCLHALTSPGIALLCNVRARIFRYAWQSCSPRWRCAITAAFEKWSLHHCIPVRLDCWKTRVRRGLLDCSKRRCAITGARLPVAIGSYPPAVATQKTFRLLL